MIASVSGSFSVMVVPSPRRLAICSEPCSASMPRFHHIQADAAAGDFGDLAAPSKSRLEDQGERLLLAQFRIGG